MMPRASTLFLAVTAVNLLVGGLLLLHSRVEAVAAQPQRDLRRGLVRDWRLTDLCLFTEARYTRHPSMADRHAPFQDHPVALEHFPSGSLLTPPLQMRPHAPSP